MRTRTTSTNANARDDDDEFAIFRFTIGSSLIADEDVPRAIGALGALGLWANHVAAGASVQASDALQRSESIGIALCIASAIAPELGKRLNDDRRRGKIESQDADARTSATFALREDASESAKEDCAWATYAILTNTLATGVMFVDDRGDVNVIRGVARARDDGGADASKAETLRRATRAWADASNVTSFAKVNESRSEYFQSRWDIDRAGVNAWGFIPPSAESVAVERSPLGVLVAWSDDERAFSRKDRAWFVALARKLRDGCSRKT